MVWTHRFEKLMLMLAYILTFLIVLCGGLASKGLALFMIAQVEKLYHVLIVNRHIKITQSKLLNTEYLISILLFENIRFRSGQIVRWNFVTRIGWLLITQNSMSCGENVIKAT